MKRIVLCFDGTWNAVTSPKTVTNVVRLANLVTVSDDEGVNQITYYNSGVGSGGPIDRFIGGAFGAGLKANVKRGLAFLALNYEEGDEIYLFGFSRGAYTARALAGVVGAAGIPLDISQTEQHWIYYQQMAKLREKEGRYPRGSPRREPYRAEIDRIREQLAKVSRNEGNDVPIQCVGVWDTVGAYGVPMGWGLGTISRAFTYWTRGFRDTRFGKTVQLGLHAVAIDEMRKPFAPTFWTLRADRELEKDQRVEQVWFPGVHSNVGGGYDDTGLSDMALAWMISRVSANTGLKFNSSEVLLSVWPCAAATIYRSSRGGPFSSVRAVLPGSTPMIASRLRGAWRWLLGAERSVMIHRVNERVHWSVSERQALEGALVEGLGSRSYAPANLPRHIKDMEEASDLERQLVDRGRTWKGKCPLEAAGSPCVCQSHGRQTQSASQPSVAA